MYNHIFLQKSGKDGYYHKEAGVITENDVTKNATLYKVILNTGIGMQEEHLVYKYEDGRWCIPLTESARNLKDEIRKEIDKIESQT